MEEPRDHDKEQSANLAAVTNLTHRGILSATTLEIANSVPTSQSSEKATDLPRSRDVDQQQGIDVQLPEIALRWSIEEPEALPLPPSPPPASLRRVRARLQAFEDYRQINAGLAAVRVQASERRQHAENLRSQFMEAARAAINTSFGASRPTTEGDTGGVALALLEELFEAALSAEADVKAVEATLVQNEYQLSRITEPIFERETSSVDMFDILNEADIDIRGVDEMSITSSEVSDGFDTSLLGFTTNQIAKKLERINVLEDLFTNIETERLAAVGVSTGEDVAELLERGSAIQKEIAIAHDELEQLREGEMPDSSGFSLDLDVTMSGANTSR